MSDESAEPKPEIVVFLSEHKAYRVQLAQDMLPLFQHVLRIRSMSSATERTSEIAGFTEHMRKHASRFVNREDEGYRENVKAGNNFLRHILEVCMSELDAAEQDMIRNPPQENPPEPPKRTRRVVPKRGDK